MIVGAMELTHQDERSVEVLRTLARALKTPVVLTHACCVASGTTTLDFSSPGYKRACMALNAIADQLESTGVVALPCVVAGTLDAIEELGRQLEARFMVYRGYTLLPRHGPQRRSASLA